MNDNPFNNLNPKYFCNRIHETEFCYAKIESKESFYLISSNGIGKTRLIKHIFDELSNRDKHYLVYINLLSISGPRQFLAVFLSEILNFFSKKSKSKREQLNEIVFEKDNSQRIGLFEMPELELKLKLTNVIDFLGTEKKVTIIAIDNFHFFNDFKSPLINDLFWKDILNKKGAQFIFSGSEKIVLREKLPFLLLPKIEENIYRRYIVDLFDESKISISKKAMSLLFNWSEGNTSVIQSICAKLYQNRITKIKASHVKFAIAIIQSEQDNSLQIIRNLLSAYQWRLFNSIALEGIARQVTSERIMKKYDLNAPSSVKTALTALLEKGLIIKVNDGYQLTNLFLANRIKEIQSTF